MIYILTAAGIFLAELLIKNHVEDHRTEGKEEAVLSGRMIIRKYHNRGAFLNAGEGKRTVVLSLSLLLTAVVSVLFVLSFSARGNTLLRTGLSLLLGGAFSNTYDRLKRKYVVDYLSFNVRSKRLRSVVFNLSDFCILIGALLTVAGYR